MVSFLLIRLSIAAINNHSLANHNKELSASSSTIHSLLSLNGTLPRPRRTSLKKSLDPYGIDDSRTDYWLKMAKECLPLKSFNSKYNITGSYDIQIKTDIFKDVLFHYDLCYNSSIVTDEYVNLLAKNIKPVLDYISDSIEINGIYEACKWESILESLTNLKLDYLRILMNKMNLYDAKL